MAWTRPEQAPTRRREDMTFPDKTRTCRDCRKTKPWSEFPPKGCDENNVVIRVLPRCMPCHTAQRARYRAKAKAQNIEPEVFLDPEPLRRFLLENIERRGVPDYELKRGETPHMSALEAESGVPARSIRRILDREADSVSLDIADRLITGLGGVFALVYPYEGHADDQPITEAERLTLLTKRCPDCDQVKSWAEFRICKRWPDGTARTLQAYCKFCDRARKKDYRRRNRTVVAERSRLYYAENREVVLARKQEYNAEHREQISASKREYRRKNAELLREKRRAYLAANREANAERCREYRRRKKAEREAAKRAAVVAPPTSQQPIDWGASGCIPSATQQQPELELAA